MFCYMFFTLDHIAKEDIMRIKRKSGFTLIRTTGCCHHHRDSCGHRRAHLPEPARGRMEVNRGVGCVRLGACHGEDGVRHHHIII